MLDSKKRDEFVERIERAQISALHRALDDVWYLGYKAGRELMENEHTIFTEEALKSQDGKKVPLTREPGGPVIGEATLKFDPETGTLNAEFEVDSDNPMTAAILKAESSAITFKQETKKES